MNETISSTAEQHSSNINNYNVIDNSSDNISSDQQPIYNENITSTLPPGSSPCVPNPQQTIENTTFPLNSFNMNNTNYSDSLPPISSPSVPNPQQTIENIPYQLGSFNMSTIHPSQSEIFSFDIPDNNLNYSFNITNTQFQ
ncbi:hypothetical protein C1646_748927 [Rhizophagus diaphanus]|nr:hypothetical protein C1646_748927 [Rhizophagus diaphanus] [Rhizophagus sp. MUCL 43196]